MSEAHPLAEIQQVVLAFCRGRKDVVLFGAQAVNLYVATPRMSADVDLLSPRAGALAHEIAALLRDKLRIAARVREVAPGAHRVYQVRKPANRHLVDVRSLEAALPTRTIRGVAALAPEALVALKVVALTRRSNQPKGATDLADLRRLLLRFPALRAADGVVTRLLGEIGADAQAARAWQDLLAQPIEPDRDEGY